MFTRNENAASDDRKKAFASDTYLTISGFIKKINFRGNQIIEKYNDSITFNDVVKKCEDIGHTLELEKNDFIKMNIAVERSLPINEKRGIKKGEVAVDGHYRAGEAEKKIIVINGRAYWSYKRNVS